MALLYFLSLTIVVLSFFLINPNKFQAVRNAIFNHLPLFKFKMCPLFIFINTLPTLHSFPLKQLPKNDLFLTIHVKTVQPSQFHPYPLKVCIRSLISKEPSFHFHPLHHLRHLRIVLTQLYTNVEKEDSLLPTQYECHIHYLIFDSIHFLSNPHFFFTVSSLL